MVLVGSVVGNVLLHPHPLELNRTTAVRAALWKKIKPAFLLPCDPATFAVQRLPQMMRTAHANTKQMRSPVWRSRGGKDLSWRRENRGEK